MKIGIYCIYKKGENLPSFISTFEPKDEFLQSSERVCLFEIDQKDYYGKPDEIPVDVSFKDENEWFPKGALFNILEYNESLDKWVQIADAQGYAHKKAKSIIKNLNIAYPKNIYILHRKVKDVQKKTQESTAD